MEIWNSMGWYWMDLPLWIGLGLFSIKPWRCLLLLQWWEMVQLPQDPYGCGGAATLASSNEETEAQMAVNRDWKVGGKILMENLLPGWVLSL
jgi:hypothetical protein